MAYNPCESDDPSSKRTLRPFVLGSPLFTLSSDKLFQLTDLIVTRGALPSGRHALILPAIIAEIAPVAWLLATLMAYSRMGLDNEIVPPGWRVSFFLVARPAFVSAIALSLFLVWFNHAVLPHANWSFKSGISTSSTARGHHHPAPFFISELTAISSTSRTKTTWRPPWRDGTPSTPRPNISAPLPRRPAHLPSPFPPRDLPARDGEIHEEARLTHYRRMTFDTYDLDLTSTGLWPVTTSKPPATSRKLRELATIRQREGNWIEQRLCRSQPRMELHKRIAIPFACLAFGMVGPPGVLVRRGGGRASASAWPSPSFITSAGAGPDAGGKVIVLPDGRLASQYHHCPIGVGLMRRLTRS